MTSMISQPVGDLKTAVSQSEASLKIAYTIQNVGLNLTKRVGDVVPVLNTLDGLKTNGHEVHVFELGKRAITKASNTDHITEKRPLPLTITGKRPFFLAESLIRRLQTSLKMPYFAFIDSWRFFDGLSQVLQTYDLCHEHNGLFSPASALACQKTKNLTY